MQENIPQFSSRRKKGDLIGFRKSEKSGIKKTILPLYNKDHKTAKARTIPRLLSGREAGGKQSSPGYWKGCSGTNYSESPDNTQIAFRARSD